MARITLRNQSGFSFVEIVVVIVLIAVFAAVAIVRHNFQDPTLAAQSQVFKAHMRYAQTRSMGTDSIWGIKYQVDGDTRSYWLFKQPDSDTRIPLPGETDDHVRLDSMGIVISQGSFELEFDGWGRPSSSLTGGDTLTLDLTKSGDSEQVLVIRNTGFIP